MLVGDMGVPTGVRALGASMGAGDGGSRALLGSSDGGWACESGSRDRDRFRGDLRLPGDDMDADGGTQGRFTT